MPGRWVSVCVCACSRCAFTYPGPGHWRKCFQESAVAESVLRYGSTRWHTPSNECAVIYPTKLQIRHVRPLCVRCDASDVERRRATKVPSKVELNERPAKTTVAAAAAAVRPTERVHKARARAPLISCCVCCPDSSSTWAIHAHTHTHWHPFQAATAPPPRAVWPSDAQRMDALLQSASPTLRTRSARNLFASDVQTIRCLYSMLWCMRVCVRAVFVCTS